MRLIKAHSVLAATCLIATMLVSGCDNSGVNEDRSAGKGTVATEGGPPPPKTIKEYAEQQRKKTAPAKAGAAPKAGGEAAKP